MLCKYFSVILLSFLMFNFIECGTKKSWQKEITTAIEKEEKKPEVTEIPETIITTTVSDVENAITQDVDVEEDDSEIEEADEEHSILSDNDIDLDIIETEKNKTKISFDDVANVTLDQNTSIVNVTLNEQAFKQIFTGSKF